MPHSRGLRNFSFAGLTWLYFNIIWIPEEKNAEFLGFTGFTRLTLLYFNIIWIVTPRVRSFTRSLVILM